MKTLNLACPGVNENGWGLTIVVEIPCNNGYFSIPTPDPVAGSVPVVPLQRLKARS